MEQQSNINQIEEVPEECCQFQRGSIRHFKAVSHFEINRKTMLINDNLLKQYRNGTVEVKLSSKRITHEDQVLIKAWCKLSLGLANFKDKVKLCIKALKQDDITTFKEHMLQGGFEIKKYFKLSILENKFEILKYLLKTFDQNHKKLIKFALKRKRVIASQYILNFLGKFPVNDFERPGSVQDEENQIEQPLDKNENHNSAIMVDKRTKRLLNNYAQAGLLENYKELMKVASPEQISTSLKSAASGGHVGILELGISYITDPVEIFKLGYNSGSYSVCSFVIDKLELNQRERRDIGELGICSTNPGIREISKGLLKTMEDYN
jgi:hypothetical protein